MEKFKRTPPSSPLIFTSFRTKSPNNALSLTYDPSSPIPWSDQIKTQIKAFKKMNIVDTRSLVSMDQFKDMLAIEKAFGPI